MIVTTGHIESEGHKLAYQAHNEDLYTDDKPILIFIHGVLASINFWPSCLPDEIKKQRTWYSLSLPAHHPSKTPQEFNAEQVEPEWFYRLMNGAVQAISRGRPTVVIGHSTGGFCALNLAIHQAPHVSGIISIAGFHHGQWGGVEGLLIKLAGLGNHARGLFNMNIRLAQKSQTLRHLFASMLAHDRTTYQKSTVSQQMLKAIENDSQSHNPADLFELFRGIGTLEIADQLQNIRIPCYLFAGTHDPVVNAAQSLLLTGKIPHAKTRVFGGTGHMPFMEATNEFNRTLIDAINDIDSLSKLNINETKELLHELS